MRKFCLLCDTIDEQRSFRHNDTMKTPVQNDLRLVMALESTWIVCAHESQTSTSLCLHKSGSNGLFHTSSCRKHFDFSKVKVHDSVAHDQAICSPLRSLLQSVEREYQRSASSFQVHSACTRRTNNRNITCSDFSSAMDSLTQLFPRIRTVLNGRLNERSPVCSRR